jgi:hypothetical protein
MMMGSTPSCARLSFRVGKSIRLYNQKHKEAVMVSLSNRSTIFMTAKSGMEAMSQCNFPVGFHRWKQFVRQKVINQTPIC